MAKGFIFNHNKCVGCNACIAGCILENNWSFLPRKVYTFNPDPRFANPVVNLSLACNHCKTAICLEGCPASAYYREPLTGAVVIDDSKCIGCRYCQWNCPYDAPKFKSAEGLIGKCDYCYKRLREDMIPACAGACPTGALEYDNIYGTNGDDLFPLFPDKDLEPALKFKGLNLPVLRVFPPGLFENGQVKNFSIKNELTPEWSLIAFSFLATLSVSESISALISGAFPGRIQFIAIILFAGLLSLFHLGKKERAWRAVVNIKGSPLSREILLFILYSLVAVPAVIIQMPLLLVASSITGLAFLLAIDTVYIFTDKRKSVFLHSGQTFLTALLIASFIADMRLPFAFIGALKLAAVINRMIATRNDSAKYSIRFIRAAFLVITGSSLILNRSNPESSIITLFLAGELLDRILFYLDFKPLNINRLNTLSSDQEYEKKRD